MKLLNICCYCLFCLWQPITGALELDSAIVATAQWMVNTNSTNSQALNITLLPELDVGFENGWQIQSSLRLRS